MEMQRFHHAVGTKPQRLLQVIREAQGVRFAPEGTLVLRLLQGMGIKFALCRRTPCSGTTAFGLFLRSQESILMLTPGSGLSSRFFGGIFQYLHPLLSSESSEMPFASLVLSVALAFFSSPSNLPPSPLQ